MIPTARRRAGQIAVENKSIASLSNGGSSLTSLRFLTYSSNSKQEHRQRRRSVVVIVCCVVAAALTVSVLVFAAERESTVHNDKASSAQERILIDSKTKRNENTENNDNLHLVSERKPSKAHFSLASQQLSIVQLLQEELPDTVKIHKPKEPLDTCVNTMVTGYYRLRSKYAAEEYMKWMQNMLSVQDCMVIFTSSSAVQNITHFRNHALSKTVLIELSLDDLPLSRMGADFWKHQLDIDHEKLRHRSYQLFWIWLSKSWSVVQAIRKNFFQSDLLGSGIFMWQDIGAFRHKQYNGKLILKHTEIIPPKSILWLAHHPINPPSHPIWNDKWNEKEHYFHSGSQGAGSAPAWLEYHDYFAQTAQQFVDRDMFLGEDQCVLQSTCQQHPNLCAYVQRTDVNDNHYFGLRYVLRRGGNLKLWTFPPVVEG